MHFQVPFFDVRARLSIIAFRQGQVGDLAQEIDLIQARSEIMDVELGDGRHELRGGSIDRDTEADKITRFGLIRDRQTQPSLWARFFRELATGKPGNTLVGVAGRRL